MAFVSGGEVVALVGAVLGTALSYWSFRSGRRASDEAESALSAAKSYEVSLNAVAALSTVTSTSPTSRRPSIRGLID